MMSAGNLRRNAVAALMLLSLPGCAGVALEGANIAKDKAVAEANMKEATAGVAEAQYKVGKSLCCSLDEGGPSFYNTEQAVVGLCRAAAQSHRPAAQELGGIYSGDLVSGLRVMRRVAEKVADPRTNLPVSYAWLSRAKGLGVADAANQADKVWQRMTPADQATATALTTGQKPLPCEWNAAMGQT